MANLSFIEKNRFEKLFGMKTGYVLDFSDRTFQEFVGDAVGIDIYEEKYNYGSGSKANRLRGFWSVETNYNIGRLLEKLLEYWLAQVQNGEINHDSADEKNYEECLVIVDKLKSENPVDPTENHTIGIYHNHTWYKAKIKQEGFDRENPVESIDAAILTRNLLAPLFKIKNLRTDNRIKFVGGVRGIKELEKLVDSGKQKMAFALYPVSVNQLLAVADAGGVMPPKSTWFEPKLRSGMVVNLLSK